MTRSGGRGTAPAEPEERPRGDAFTGLVVRTFRLNGLFLARGDLMAKRAGLTSARWQVLGAVLRAPLPVSGIAREMGLTRQSVQRLADRLVRDGMADYRPNPRHRRAKLLAPTSRGREAIDVIRPLQHSFADQVTEDLEVEELRQAVRVLDRLIARIEGEPWGPPPPAQDAPALRRPTSPGRRTG